MTDSDYIFEGFRDTNDTGIFFKKGKPFFRDGRIVFYRGCCCLDNCARKTFFVYINGVEPSSGWGPTPDSPPMRDIYGESHILYFGEAYDTIAPKFYWGFYWVIEYCWNDFDWNPKDNQPPDESYEAELNEWAQRRKRIMDKDFTLAWDGVEVLDNDYRCSMFLDRVFPAMDLTDLVDRFPDDPDKGYADEGWQRDDHVGPLCDSQCKNCLSLPIVTGEPLI